MSCTPKALALPKIVAIATDKYLTPTYPSVDPTITRAGGTPPKYGQDFTFGSGRAAPGGYSVGKTEGELKPKMEKLISIFASKDSTGMAKRLFNQASGTEITEASNVVPTAMRKLLPKPSR